MPTNNQYYRLLNEGEAIREGDEYWDPATQEWTGEDQFGVILRGVYPTRRPLDYNPEAVPLMLEALEDIGEYTGEGGPGTPWRDIVRGIGLKARKALAAAKERGAE